MEYDVWFARYEDDLYCAIAAPGGPPMGRPQKVPNVSIVYKRLKEKGHRITQVRITQVGIIDPEMIGLE